MSEIVLFASEHLAELPVSHALGRAACALGRGEGPSLNPKLTPNEDSLFIVERNDQLLVGVADSHFGHQAGERLVRNLLEQVEDVWPSGATSLWESVLMADEKGIASVNDRSESTFLVALVAGSTVHWVSVADSVLYLVTAEGIKALNIPTRPFGGGRTSLRSRQQRVKAAGGELVDRGSISLDRGDLLLLCSDGILEETSGMRIDDIRQTMLRNGSLVERTAAVALRACTRAHGGGRDNVGIVAVEVP